MRLGAAGWTIILQAAATYCAVFSAYLFALPVLRGQSRRDDTELLSGLTDPDPRLDALRRSAVRVLTNRTQREVPRDHRAMWLGVVFLGASLLLFSAALWLQLETDPAFHSPLG